MEEFGGKLTVTIDSMIIDAKSARKMQEFPKEHMYA